MTKVEACRPLLETAAQAAAARRENGAGPFLFLGVFMNGFQRLLLGFQSFILGFERSLLGFERFLLGFVGV